MDRKTNICKACDLGNCPKVYNASKPWGNPNAPLVVYMDCPGSPLAEKLLIWLFEKCGLSGNDVYVDYLVKCPLPKGRTRKALVEEYKSKCWTVHPRIDITKKVGILAGNYSAELLADVKMKDWNGRYDKESECWIIYSFAYLLMNPGECVRSWRVIFKAAEQAGLKPKMVMDIPMFKFPSKKII